MTVTLELSDHEIDLLIAAVEVSTPVGGGNAMYGLSLKLKTAFGREGYDGHIESIAHAILIQTLQHGQEVGLCTMTR